MLVLGTYGKFNGDISADRSPIIGKSVEKELSLINFLQFHPFLELELKLVPFIKELSQPWDFL